MLRGMVVMALVAGAFATGFYFREHDAPSPIESVKKSLEGANKATQRVPQQSCEDDCEQTAIVVQAPDAQLKACKARCKGQAGPPAPHEVPRSITVAPADHRGGLLPPPDQRIQRSR